MSSMHESEMSSLVALMNSGVDYLYSVRVWSSNALSMHSSFGRLEGSMNEGAIKKNS